MRGAANARVGTRMGPPRQMPVVKVDRLGCDDTATRLERDVVQEVKRLALLAQAEHEVRDARDHGRGCYGAAATRLEQGGGRIRTPLPLSHDHAMSASDPIDPCPRQTVLLEVNDADDGLVVYDPKQETVHHLNRTAGLMFQLCDGTNDVSAIARAVAAAYSLDAPPTPDARAALDTLEQRKLITWRET